VLGPHSVLVLDGSEHVQARRLMLPPFHGDAVRAYAERVADVAVEEVEQWPVGVPMALRPRMQAIALQVILRAVIGVRDERRFAQLRALLPQLLSFNVIEMWLVWMFPKVLDTALARRHPFTRVRPEVDRLLFEEIAEHRADPEGRDDVLAMLVAARDGDGQALNDQMLRDQLVTLLLAGHETTATGLAWAFERLLRHPDVLRRLTDEIDAGREDAYLTAVVNETLRVRPVIDGVWRKLTAPAVIGGRRLPAGTTVMPSIALVQLSHLYPDAHAFRPERFLDAPPPSYSLIPFGGGTRRCIGASFATMEMKAVLRTVLARVELLAADPKPEATRVQHVTLVPDRGARAVVVGRRTVAPPAQEVVPAGAI
jgi:cytochrome P450 family 135